MWFLYLRNLLILWFFSFLINSCGYQFLGKPSYFDPNWKTIYIAPWKNFTSETALGEMLAYEVRKKLAQGKFLVPVYDESEADLVLKGEITRVYLVPVAYETFIQTKERRIVFTGKYQLIDKKEKKVILENNLDRYETYRVPLEEVNVLDPGRQEALSLLSKDLADIILQQIMFKEIEFK